jgi:hypothetical protein
VEAVDHEAGAQHAGAQDGAAQHGAAQHGADPVTRLRATAAAVADLDLPAEGAGQDEEYDATAHAELFSDLHDALVAVLTDLDEA